MDIEVLALLIPITAIVGSLILVFYLRSFENKERMAMIEKGVDPSLFTKKQKAGSSGSLRASLLFVGAGVGLLLGYVLDTYTRMQAPLPYFAMILVFGGIGLGAAYLIEEKKIKEEQAKEKM